jgi:hypothetical protein
MALYFFLFCFLIYLVAAVVKMVTGKCHFYFCNLSDRFCDYKIKGGYVRDTLYLFKRR